jgi:hypothetical protein
MNCPTLALDRVNGAKVLADAKAGKTATLTLRARFQRDVGRAMIGYLPGKNYGTPLDQQILLATHTDAMSLIEENGGIGMIGIASYFNKLPRATERSCSISIAGTSCPAERIPGRSSIITRSTRSASNRSWPPSASSTWADARPSRPARTATAMCIRAKSPRMAASLRA